MAKQQDKSVDSLKRLIAPVLNNNAQAIDTTTIKRIDKLAAKYFDSYPDSTYYYGKLEIGLAKKINYNLGVANGTAKLAAVNTFRGNYTESAKNYNAALKIYQQFNNYKGISDSYNGLGHIQDFLGNYDAALQLYRKSLAYCLKTPSEIDEGHCYNLMGISYDSKGDLSKALDCYFKSLFIDIKYNNNRRAADKYSNIGIIMQELELYPKALTYYNRALALWQKAGDQQGISTGCLNIGDLYIIQEKYPQAIGYIRKAHAIFTRMNDSEGLGMVYYDLGLYNYFAGYKDSAKRYLNLALKSALKNKIRYNKAYAYQGLAKVYNLEKNYTLAYKYALQAQKTARQLNSLIAMTDATLQLSTALAGLKRFEEAYQQHRQYSAYKSDLRHNESINKVMLYNLEIDFNKKQRDLAYSQRKKELVYQQRLDKQRNENLISAAIIIILTIIILVYYNAKSKQQKINRLLAEKNKEIISQQEDLNAQATKLNELNILKDRLIGVLAHDLRAPISTLRGLFNLMTDASITAAEFIELTPKVFNTLEHTSDFLDTLLFWINSQVDASENKTKNFLLAGLVDRELLHLEDKLQQKNIIVQLALAPDAVALADPNPVRIVIHNFLTNAIKFSNRNGVLEISASLQGDEVEFCIKDHGIGMSPEYLNTLFKSQVISNAGTENESGTGMGLLFCKDLIQKQNGRIWANSSLGQGTELCFAIPAGTPAGNLFKNN
ncbi:tetratricopeptide repeat-containing sensor histidine kinase [Mucilaginibacter sp. UR6-11]|uniref:tetratricopeptide repeat-containing sensor histidine kinase n=1 Tax=Mucilaginibacter sp. UR6-11 TaxID=1435644 RepID=UPI001E3DBE76|nr:tetratricopeptide repeat-containing sensor histidine kinase [Mucilaginibacter sp. UR6-11]MCC8425782.1 tetratricopeptide repeat protein [Mucilaginibacter sp. UR6-11]